MPTRTIRFEEPLELRATLRPITFPWGRWVATGWLRPARTPEGPATMHVHRDGSGIHGEAWGAGAAWMIERLGRWTGLEDDPASFQPDHPLVADLHRRRLGVRFARTDLVFEAALVAVLAQKVTGREASSGLRGLMSRFSDGAPGPFEGLRLPPDPEAMAAAPYHAFHDLGIEKRRTDVVRRLSAEAERLERLSGQHPGRAGMELQARPGVGPWTAAETVAVSHGDADALSVGDFHLKHVAAWHLTGRPRGTDELMVRLLEPFRPHRGRVMRLLETAGGYPRYGPRQAGRSFARY